MAGGGGTIKMGFVFLPEREENRTSSFCCGRTQREKEAIYKWGRQLSPEHDFASTLILDFWSLEL